MSLGGWPWGSGCLWTAPSWCWSPSPGNGTAGLAVVEAAQARDLGGSPGRGGLHPDHRGRLPAHRVRGGDRRPALRGPGVDRVLRPPASLVVALTLIPMLAAGAGRPGPDGRGRGGPAAARAGRVGEAVAGPGRIWSVPPGARQGGPGRMVLFTLLRRLRPASTRALERRLSPGSGGSSAVVRSWIWQGPALLLGRAGSCFPGSGSRWCRSSPRGNWWWSSRRPRERASPDGGAGTPGGGPGPGEFPEVREIFTNVGVRGVPAPWAAPGSGSAMRPRSGPPGGTLARRGSPGRPNDGAPLRDPGLQVRVDRPKLFTVNAPVEVEVRGFDLRP
jgi:hypothetical protein